MSYLLDCVAGPSRHFGHALRNVSRAPIAPRPTFRSNRTGILPKNQSSPSRRYQSTSTPVVIDTISTTTEPSILDPLVNILLSSPLPAWATIIGLTICVRTAVTLPVTLWQRGRMMTEAREVRPRMKAINEKLAVALARECREKGLGYEEYKEQLKAKLAIEQAALHKRFKTHPTITMIAPLAVHVPILITLSLTLRRALEVPGSSMASEGFLWLSTLGDVDPVGALPLLGAMIALTNAETLGRKREQAMEALEARKTAASRTARPRVSRPPPQKPKPVEKAKPVEVPASPARYESPPGVRNKGQARHLSTSAHTRAVHRPIIRKSSRSQRTLDEIPAAEGPTDGKLTDADKANVRSVFLTYVLRGMAVLFIPFASTAPAALAMYWVTSLSYTLAQTLVLNRIDKNAQAKRVAAKA